MKGSFGEVEDVVDDSSDGGCSFIPVGDGACHRNGTSFIWAPIAVARLAGVVFAAGARERRQYRLSIRHAGDSSDGDRDDESTGQNTPGGS